ncbi:MAG: hypothetical protein H6561_21215 [Lewinellaceae bacterium]|nr:hypothetical protein [Lewinellaceae bacterium]
MELCGYRTNYLAGHRPAVIADDIAQALFDNCFDITDGPDAPDIGYRLNWTRSWCWFLTNDTINSNNAFEAYHEKDLQAPAGIDDGLYFFEGYKIYQLQSSDVSVGELDNFDKARLIYQVDLMNNVRSVYNWKSLANPNSSEPIWVPGLQVEVRIKAFDIHLR